MKRDSDSELVFNTIEEWYNFFAENCPTAVDERWGEVKHCNPFSVSCCKKCWENSGCKVVIAKGESM